MLIRTVTLAVLLILGTHACAYAQLEPGTLSGDLAVFATTTTDPNAAVPVLAPVNYLAASFVCGLPHPSPLASVTNPTSAYFDDPTDATKSCRLSVGPQLKALGFGTYLAALKLNGLNDATAYGPLSNPFNRRLMLPANLQIR